ETVAFGDWLNDLSMFNEAGLAIAPANAVPEVKEKAGIISAFSNDQDFIAIELQRLLTERKIIA
ncbi:MAG TPA: Cof-type HAD-IIB family hydrolase, partial [Firmicutes bacterium]|nr:Cof-type HAD-IIB family hydrolase [Bacillota bacterium]